MRPHEHQLKDQRAWSVEARALASPKSSMSLRDREGNENRLFRAGAGVVGDFQRNLPLKGSGGRA
jgi:hypothetical protein